MEPNRALRPKRGPSARLKLFLRPAQKDLEFQETIAELRAELGYLEVLANKAMQLKAQYTRLCASLAQTDNEYFQIMCKVMNPLVDSFPRHPLVRQWLAVRKIWRDQLLKQN